jgi:DNA-binding NarL/FixJ family response regulator
MAQEQRRVLLCGDSLFIAGLEASLRTRPSLVVERAESSLVEVPRDLQDDLPRVVIFDLASPALPNFPLASLVAVLREGIDLHLVGLDPNSSKAVVLSGHRRRILSADELNQLLFA